MNVMMIQKITQKTEKGSPMMKGVSLFPMANNGNTINKKGASSDRQ